MLFPRPSSAGHASEHFQRQNSLPSSRHSSFTGSLTGLARQGSAGGERRLSTPPVCMAHPRRVARVAKQLEREVGTLLMRDPVLLTAVNPERRRGVDVALSALATVTDVELSSDLQVAKIYISVFSDQQGQEQAARGLARLQGYVRSRVASIMNLRVVPEIHLVTDNSLQKGQEVLALLDRAKLQQAGLPFDKAPPAGVGFESVESRPSSPPFPNSSSNSSSSRGAPSALGAFASRGSRDGEEEGEEEEGWGPLLDEGSSGNNGVSGRRRKFRPSVDADAVAGGQNSAGESDEGPTDEEGDEDESGSEGDDSDEEEREKAESDRVVAAFLGSSGASAAAAAELQLALPFDSQFPTYDHQQQHYKQLGPARSRRPLSRQHKAKDKKRHRRQQQRRG